MATSITTINSTDLITNSRADINNNFDSILVNKMETSVLSTDSTFAAASDSKIPSELAVKRYVDAGGNVNASETTKGIVEEATQAEVDAGTATGGTGARLFINPSASPKAKFPVSTAFSGTSPSTFTDLDLSSIVGAYSRVVFLKVVAGTTAVSFHFRKNGETGVWPLNGDRYGGLYRTNDLASGEIGYVMAVTDASGVVEWITTQSGVGQSSTTSTVTVEAYW